MGNIGMRELVIILLVVLVVFGAKKLRNIGSDLGAAVKGFKKSMGEGESESTASTDTPPRQIPPSDRPDADFTEATRESQDSKADRKSA